MSRKFLTPLQLPADPVNALEAVTKQYADGLVVIAATDPIAANPSCELWYDTTDPGVSPPNMPRGFVAYISSTFSGQLPASVATNMGGAQNVTFLSGRRYRITAIWPANRSGGQSSININGVGGYWWTIASGWDGHTYVLYVTGDGGTRSVYVAITPGAICDHSGVFVLIEDIGGV